MHGVSDTALHVQNNTLSTPVIAICTRTANPWEVQGKYPAFCTVKLTQETTSFHASKPDRTPNTKKYQALNILQKCNTLVANSNPQSPVNKDSSSPHTTSPPSSLPRRPSRRRPGRRASRTRGRAAKDPAAADGDPPILAIRRAAAILIRAQAVQPHAAAHVHPPRLAGGESAEAVSARTRGRLGGGGAHDRRRPAPVVAADAVRGRGGARVARRHAVPGCDG